jgi:hypothetical protein
MLYSVGDHAECQRRGTAACLGLGGAIGHHTGQRGDLTDPPSVVFAFNLDREHRSHLCQEYGTVARQMRAETLCRGWSIRWAGAVPSRLMHDVHPDVPRGEVIKAQADATKLNAFIAQARRDSICAEFRSVDDLKAQAAIFARGAWQAARSGARAKRSGCEPTRRSKT